jgi:hypothetical protein
MSPRNVLPPPIGPLPQPSLPFARGPILFAKNPVAQFAPDTKALHDPFVTRTGHSVGGPFSFMAGAAMLLECSPTPGWLRSCCPWPWSCSRQRSCSSVAGGPEG